GARLASFGDSTGRTFTQSRGSLSLVSAGDAGVGGTGISVYAFQQTAVTHDTDYAFASELQSPEASQDGSGRTAFTLGGDYAASSNFMLGAVLTNSGSDDSAPVALASLQSRSKGIAAYSAFVLKNTLVSVTTGYGAHTFETRRLTGLSELPNA